VSKIDLNPGNNWGYTFTDLKKQENGTDIVYTLETDGADGYTTEVTGGRDDGFVVTNTKKKEEKPNVPANTTDKPDSGNTTTTKTATTKATKAEAPVPKTYDPGKTGDYMVLLAGSAAALLFLAARRASGKKAHQNR